VAFDELTIQAVQDVIALSTPALDDGVTPIEVATEISSSPDRSTHALVTAGRLIKSLVMAVAEAQDRDPDDLLQEIAAQIMRRVAISALEP
jgi:hypothetical protein